MSDCNFETLLRLEPVIADVLTDYNDSLPIRFGDIHGASLLRTQADKPYLAKSSSPVFSRKGHSIGDITLIAFEEGDGTGAESKQYNLANTYVEDYPREGRTIPRSKSSLIAEVHIPIANVSLGAYGAWESVARHSGILDLLGFDFPDSQRIVKVGSLGVENGLKVPIEQRATYTTGNIRDEVNWFMRFGDPHAVFCPEDSTTPRNKVVVAGFWGLTPEVNGRYGNIFRQIFSAKMPF